MYARVAQGRDAAASSTPPAKAARVPAGPRRSMAAPNARNTYDDASELHSHDSAPTCPAAQLGRRVCSAELDDNHSGARLLQAPGRVQGDCKANPRRRGEAGALCLPIAVNGDDQRRGARISKHLAVRDGSPKQKAHR